MQNDPLKIITKDTTYCRPTLHLEAKTHKESKKKNIVLFPYVTKHSILGINLIYCNPLYYYAKPSLKYQPAK